MIFLLALLWCIYLSECVVRQRPGEWLFRARVDRRFRAQAEPDAEFLGGTVGLSWTPVLPWAAAYLIRGGEVDPDAARARLREIQQAIRWHRVTAGLLFVWLMIGGTVLVLNDRLLSVLVPYVLIAGIFWLSTLITFFVSHGRVHGCRPTLETWIGAVLSPVTLMRTPQAVMLSAMAHVHPVAAGAILLSGPEFVKVARLWHFDRADLRPAIERAARSTGVQDQLCAPPGTWERGVARFCPRCHETYTAGAEKCADCGEVRLLALPSRT